MTYVLRSASINLDHLIEIELSECRAELLTKFQGLKSRAGDPRWRYIALGLLLFSGTYISLTFVLVCTLFCLDLQTNTCFSCCMNTFMHYAILFCISMFILFGLKLNLTMINR